jgi:DNA-binding MarR family transcriptional regulator
MDQYLSQVDDAIAALIRVFTISEGSLPSGDRRTRFSALDFETLAFLQRNPGARAKDIADFLAVSPTTMQSVIDRLTKRGLVSRDEDQLPGRSVALQLTRSGRKAQDNIQRQNLANCERMLQALPAQDRELFVQNLSRIAKAVSEGQ